MQQIRGKESILGNDNRTTKTDKNERNQTVILGGHDNKMCKGCATSENILIHAVMVLILACGFYIVINHINILRDDVREIRQVYEREHFYKQAPP